MTIEGGGAAATAATATSATHAETIEEARRLVASAETAGIPLRLLGGTAIVWRTPDVEHPALQRVLQDVDFITRGSARSATTEMMVRAGYVADSEFNALHGRRRLLFMDPAHARQVDVFVDSFSMCHDIPLSGRLDVDPATLPLAELVLTKLQIVKLNVKDRTDLYRLLLRYAIGPGDGGSINRDRLAALVGADWGLFRTVELNHERLVAALPELDVSAADRATIAERLDALARTIHDAPKSMRWKARARVGDRVRWYEDPDDP